MTDEHDTFEEQDPSGVPEGLPCVELEFSTLRRFREEMAPYLNYDGFFARTDRPLPRGTTVEFKFGMPEDFVLAQGTAVVAWTIEPETNPELVPGMALRFGQVGKQSRAVIDELVDFHIATGGDPFDVGPRAARAGEIPTDSLGGAGGGVSSTIDSPASAARDLPLPPDPERMAPADDGVLPDWLSDTSGQAGQESPEMIDSFSFESENAPNEEHPSPPSSSESFDFSAGSSGDEFEVDMIFDNGEKDLTPKRPDEGSFQQMAMAPRADNKPPRDLRLGLVVTAAIVLIAVVVLVWSVWLRRPDPEAVVSPPQIDETAEVGVALIEDDLEGEDLEVAAEDGEAAAADHGAETPSDMAAETAARMASELRADEPEDPAEETAPAEPVVGATEQVAETSANAVVTDHQSEAESQPVRQVRASKVVDVTAAARANATTVVIRGNGSFETSGFRTLLLEDPARLWASISPIETFYRPSEIEVGSPEVQRIRIGYHPEDSPPALYVVLDLEGPDVVLLDSSVQGDAIRLTVGRK